MTEDEYSEIIQYLQERLRFTELSDVNARIIEDIRQQPTEPSTQLIRYLEALESELLLGGNSTARATIDRLRANVTTVSGSPIEGMSLVLTQADQELFGVDSVDLGLGPDLSVVLSDLRRLRNDIIESRSR